nr:MAG TPA: hypothetical protein [Caudoviricetes sp.]
MNSLDKIYDPNETYKMVESILRKTVPQEKIADISIDYSGLFVNFTSHGVFVTIRIINESEVNVHIRLSFAQHEKSDTKGYLSYKYMTRTSNVVRTFSISLGSEYEDDLMTMANEIVDVIMNPEIETISQSSTHSTFNLLDRVFDPMDIYKIVLGEVGSLMLPNEKILTDDVNREGGLSIALTNRRIKLYVSKVSDTEIEANISVTCIYPEEIKDDKRVCYRFANNKINTVRRYELLVNDNYGDSLNNIAKDIINTITTISTGSKLQEPDDVVIDLTKDRFDTIKRFNDLFRPVADQLTKVMVLDHATDQGKVSFFKVVDRENRFITHMDVEDLPGINRIGDVTDECSEVLNTIFDSKPDFYYVLADTIGQRTNDKAIVHGTNPELINVVTNDNEGKLICTIKATFYGWHIVDPSGITIARYHNGLDSNYVYSLSLSKTIDIINKSL